MQLTKNADTILRRRYLLRDRNKTVIETPSEMLGNRVPRALAEAELKFGGSPADVERWTATFAEMITKCRFMPNSPLLMNAGARSGMLFACVTGDTKIPLLDGNDRRIDSFDPGDRIWLYSYDDGRVVPAEAVCLGSTRRLATLVRVTLDNGELVRCTPDHLWMLRDGTYKRADALFAGDSLMPLNRRLSDPHEDGLDSYEMVMHPGIMEWEFTHRVVGQSVVSGCAKKETVLHHIDFDKRNNDPTNLLWVTWPEMRHAIRMGKIENTRRKLLENGFDSETQWDKGRKILMEKGVLFKQSPTSAFVQQYNHKVLAVDILGEIEDVYDLAVAGYHNFALSSGIFVHNCFVLPMDDSISEMEIYEDRMEYGLDGRSGIMDTALATTLVQKSGGGTGFNFSDLRPRGDFISSSAGNGRSSGPVSFLEMMDAVTGAIQQGASRRGANIATFSCWHPSLADFITCKDPDPITGVISITSYNVSVWADDEWMRRVQYSPNTRFVGINPRNQEKMSAIKSYPDTKIGAIRESANIADDEIRVENYPVREGAVSSLEEMGVKFWTYGELFDRIIKGAWRTGDPGLIFSDRVNSRHPLRHLGRIKATNPCGEQPLLSWESCVLGHLHLAKYVRVNGDIDVDWDLMREDVHNAVRFLDNAVEICKYPLPQIRRITQANRKIGLGVMGLADMFFLMGIRYGSRESFTLAEQVMSFIQDESIQASTALAEVRGCFDSWEGSDWQNRDIKMRNGCVNTIAPTGTTARIADASSSIEPVFGLVYESHVMTTAKLVDINPIFDRDLNSWAMGVIENPDHPAWSYASFLKMLRIHEGNCTDVTYEHISEEILKHAAECGSIQDLSFLPGQMREVFVTAGDVPIEDHIRMQAVFQRHVDSSISKTINLPESATEADVRHSYLFAFENDCKGITVYRDKCRDAQVLNLTGKAEQRYPEPVIREAPDFLSSVKMAIHTPWGSMHIKICVLMPQGDVLEIFADVGRGDNDIDNVLQAVCRLASMCLRAGIPLEKVWHQLQGIGSRRPSMPTKNGRITSIPDAVATAIKIYMLGEERHGLPAILLDNSLLGEISIKDASRGAPPSRGEDIDDDIVRLARSSKSFAATCPECDTISYVHAEGCETCVACGYSQC